MSELAEFIESSVEQEPVEVAEETVQENVQEEAAEAAPEPEAEAEPEGSPTEPDKTEKTGEVPIAALLDEREKRQAYERELAQLKQQLAQQNAKPEEVPDVLDDSGKFVSHLEQKFEGKLFQNRVEMSQEFMRMTHQDYDEAEAKFVQMVQENPSLAQQMRSAQLPAKFVYDTVKKAEKLAKLENVDEFEAKTRAEIEAKVRAELEAKFEAKAKAESEKAASLSPSLANQRAAGGNTGVVSIADPLETTFNR